jgi:hypothetical protein
MDKEEMQHLISRQLDDILSQSERILGGNTDVEDIENFARFSEELKDFFRANSSNSMILERLDKIPKINMEQYKDSNFLLSAIGFLGASRLREEMIMNKAREDVRTAQGFFSSIQFLYKSEMG